MKDGVFGLVDCNNFFVSCERVFRPDFAGQASSGAFQQRRMCHCWAEQREQGFGHRMGGAVFKVRDVVARHGVAVFSSNFSLYGDMSRRVMSLLSAYTPRLDIYSVDEAVLDLTGMGMRSFCAGMAGILCARLERAWGYQSRWV